MAQPKIPGTDIGKPVMPYGSDGSDWIALLVDALGRIQVDAEVGNFPADPTTQTTLAAALTALQSIQNLVGALNDVGLDELRVRSSYGEKIFGFETNVHYLTKALGVDSGGRELNSPGVPQNKVWCITSALAYNSRSAITSISIWLYFDGDYPLIGRILSPKINEPAVLQVPAYLTAGEYIQGSYEDCVQNDNIYLSIVGYQMDAR